METTIEKIPQHLHTWVHWLNILFLLNIFFQYYFGVQKKALNLWITTETSAKFSVEFIIVFFSACNCCSYILITLFNNVPLRRWLMITILFLNFNIDGNIGMVTVGIIAVVYLVFWKSLNSFNHICLYQNIKRWKI
jgi:hypothetical protein